MKTRSENWKQNMTDGPTKAAVTLKQIPPKSRLVVVQSVYLQRPGKPSVVVESRFGRWLASKQPHLTREMEVSQDWLPLAKGWEGECGLLVVVNEEKGTDDPTAISLAEEKTLEVGIGHSAFAIIPPGESLPGFIPVTLESLYIRCRQGVAQCSVHLFPG